MKWFTSTGRPCRLIRGESGETLIITLVALVLISITTVAFLGGLATSTRASIIVDKRSTALSLASSQMEYVKNSTYVSGATTYTPASIPGADDYLGYSVTITAQALHTPDDGIQQITVSVLRDGNEILNISSYKDNR